MIAEPERRQHVLVFISKSHPHRVHEAGDRLVMDRHMLSSGSTRLTTPLDL